MAISWDVKTLASCDSTQDLAMTALLSGAEEGHVIQAMTMSGGRGRSGHKWEAPLGNIYLSAILCPEIEAARAGELAFLVAVALHQTLQAYVSDAHKITLKWPNDILVDGQKIAGILLESDVMAGQVQGIVAGIGVNIFNAPELAVSLNKVVDAPVYVNKVRDDVLSALDVVYSQWLAEGFAPIRAAWLAQAHGLGQAMTARLPTESFTGVFEGLEADGTLLLKQSDGTVRKITAGDVHFS